jgi:hypothetical protein
LYYVGAKNVKNKTFKTKGGCMMKKYLSFILAVLLVLVISPVAFADIDVTLDGEQIAFDVPPQIIDGRTMVPLRAIFEALDAEVDWNAETRTVTATRAGVVVVMQVGNSTITVAGVNVELDVPPTIIDGRTLVPARAVAESFGVNVDWNDGTRTVVLATTTSGTPTPPPTPAATVNREGLVNPANYWVELDGDRFAPGMTVNEFMALGLQVRDNELLTRSIDPFGIFTGFSFSWHDGSIWRTSLQAVVRNTGNAPILARDGYVQSFIVDDQTARAFDSIVFINGIQLGVTTPEDIRRMFGEPDNLSEGTTWITLDYRPFYNNREVNRSLMFAGYSFTFDKDSNTLTRVRIEFLDYAR